MSLRHYLKGDTSHPKAPGTDHSWTSHNSLTYIGIVKGNKDPAYMGRLSVLIPSLAKTTNADESQLTTCDYLSPFYGAKADKHNIPHSRDHAGSQHSYGFWGVPPDLETRVLVIFAEGKTNQAYWIGCIQDPYTNHMVPGIASSENTFDKTSGLDTSNPNEMKNASVDKKSTYGSTNVPSGELNRSAPGALLHNNYDSTPKPIHPLADILVKQGLSADDIRGNTTSSARRESPSQVFGISTPGRKDITTSKVSVGTKDSGATDHVTRGVGHTFVMDDGDVIGKNQLTRLRTASGHQLLMHDTEGVVYIAHGSGNAYIEMTKDGRIDVYSGVGGINLRTEGDFNLHSDANINMSAGQSIRMSATGQEPVLYTEEDIKNLDDDPFSAGHTAKVGDVKYEANPGAIIQSADYMLTLGDKGVMTSSQNGSIMDYGWAGISSYSPTNQMHGAGGQIHLAASQVHFNSTSPSGDWGPGWMTKDEVGMEPRDEGDVELTQKGVNPLNSFTRETKTTVHRLVTHEPMFRASVVSGDGVVPVDFDDKKAWSKLAHMPGTAEFINNQNRFSTNSSIRDAQFQADALTYVQQKIGNSTSAIKAKELLADFGSKYNEIYSISDKIKLPFNIKDSITEKLKLGSLSTAKDNLTSVLSSQVIESLTNKNIELFKDNVFVNTTGELFSLGQSLHGKLSEFSSLGSSVQHLTKNLSQLKNIKNLTSTIGSLNSVTQTFSSIVGGKIVGINQVKSLATKSFSKVGLFNAREAAIGGQSFMQNVTANIGSKIGSIAGSVKTFFSGWSDIRLKEDIQLISKSHSGVNIYRFKYKHTNGTYQGVMAQEVPWARQMTDTGFYMVDYSKVDVEFRRLN
tara:strand:- start:665 stop:3232 length:2568 start_codon:yes stop_codon:yes gene_type:complete